MFSGEWIIRPSTPFCSMAARVFSTPRTVFFGGEGEVWVVLQVTPLGAGLGASIPLRLSGPDDCSPWRRPVQVGAI